MRLSIIVPVYNVEEYLKHCLESVVVQMCTDFELILVDDGSTDRSGDICDGFAYEHPEHNIVVIHQPNGGLSAARNKGIEVSCGEYITFVDDDDLVFSDDDDADFDDDDSDKDSYDDDDDFDSDFDDDDDGEIILSSLSEKKPKPSPPYHSFTPYNTHPIVIKVITPK